MKFAHLPVNVQRVLTEAQCDPEHAFDSWSVREALDAYLNWNGIIGYTDDILSTVTALISADNQRS
jgi:hypothetical protein